MKTTTYSDDIVPPETLQLIDKFLSFEDTNFVAQAKFLGLDPATDFRHADLSDVDFSDCDLRGFDFTGADLRGTYGVNVTWYLGDPILDGAETSGSLFSHALEQAEFFKQYPDHLTTVERLSKGYWANSILEVENMLQTDNGRGIGTRIAAAVFDATSDATVRMNILLFMRISTRSSAEHKAFITSMLSRYSANTAVTLAGIRALSALYASHKDSFNIFQKFLSHTHPEVQKAAFLGAVQSNRFKEGISVITRYLTNYGDSLQRRMYVGRAAQFMGLRVQHAIYDWSQKRYFDFLEPIPPNSLRSWAVRDFEQFRAANPKLKPDVAMKLFAAKRATAIGRLAEEFGITFRFLTRRGATILVDRPSGIPSDLFE